MSSTQFSWPRLKTQLSLASLVAGQAQQGLQVGFAGIAVVDVGTETGVELAFPIK